MLAVYRYSTVIFMGSVPLRYITSFQRLGYSTVRRGYQVEHIRLLSLGQWNELRITEKIRSLVEQSVCGISFRRVYSPLHTISASSSQTLTNIIHSFLLLLSPFPNSNAMHCIHRGHPLSVGLREKEKIVRQGLRPLVHISKGYVNI